MSRTNIRASLRPNKVQSKGRPNTTKDINKNLSKHHSKVQTTSDPSNIATKNNLWSLNFDFLCKGNDFQRRVLKNMVWYSQKLQFVKFPLLVPFLRNWKSDTWQWATSWTFTWDFSFVTCSMTVVWLACSAKRMSRTSHSVQGMGGACCAAPTCAQPTKSDQILTASPSAKKANPHPKRTSQSWLFKSLTEIWQLFLLILHFQNFFTWHLIEGECCWRNKHYL